MMKRKLTVSIFALVFATAIVLMVTMMDAEATRGGAGGGRGNGPVILVWGGSSPGTYYDSIIAADPLPNKGRFQELVPVTPSPLNPYGLTTEFGLGDPEYLGGRWWVDSDTTPGMSADDHYFSCPLLGPGSLDPPPPPPE